MSLLHLAMRRCSPSVIQALLSWALSHSVRLDWSLRGPSGLCPLHLAAILPQVGLGLGDIYHCHCPYISRCSHLLQAGHTVVEALLRSPAGPDVAAAWLLCREDNGSTPDALAAAMVPESTSSSSSSILSSTLPSSSPARHDLGRLAYRTLQEASLTASDVSETDHQQGGSKSPSPIVVDAQMEGTTNGPNYPEVSSNLLIIPGIRGIQEQEERGEGGSPTRSPRSLCVDDYTEEGGGEGCIGRLLSTLTSAPSATAGRPASFPSPLSGRRSLSNPMIARGGGGDVCVADPSDPSEPATEISPESGLYFRADPSAISAGVSNPLRSGSRSRRVSNGSGEGLWRSLFYGFSSDNEGQEERFLKFKVKFEIEAVQMVCWLL